MNPFDHGAANDVIPNNSIAGESITRTGLIEGTHETIHVSI